LGIAVFIVGVTLVKGYGVEQNVPLDVGQSITIGSDTYTFRGVTPVTGPNYRGLSGTIEVRRGDRLVQTLRPEKRVYNASGMTMTEAAINTGFLGDRYVSLGEPVTDKGEAGAWGVRVYVKPFVDWIWGGAFLMALGGFIAMSDRRYRLAVRQKFTATAGAAPAA
jgi:cytochrome c-type biogenesis protein CcmF